MRESRLPRLSHPRGAGVRTLLALLEDCREMFADGGVKCTEDVRTLGVRFIRARQLR